MTAQPLVSLVIPTFNRAHLLPRALESVLAQDTPLWECIIVDDGSTDGTARAFREFMQDPRFRYVRTPNHGPSKARNTGAALAHAPLLAFLDSDDEHAPDHLSSRLALHAEHPAIQLAYGGASVVGEEWIRDFYDPSKFVHFSECTLTSTFSVRTEFFHALGGFDEKIGYGEDADFRDRALALDPQGVIRVQRITSRYHREHSDSLTHQATKQV